MAISVGHPIEYFFLLIVQSLGRGLAGGLECLHSGIYFYTFVADQLAKDRSSGICHRPERSVVIDGTRHTAPEQVKMCKVAVKEQLIQACLIDVMALGGEIFHHRSHLWF